MCGTSAKKWIVMACCLLAGGCAADLAQEEDRLPTNRLRALRAVSDNHEYAMVVLGETPQAARAHAQLTPRKDGAMTYKVQDTTFDLASVWGPTEDGLVHKQSGMTCDAEIPVLSLAIDKAYVFQAEGLDVGCHYRHEKEPIFATFYASYAPDISVQDHLANAVRSMKKRFSETTPKQYQPNLQMSGRAGQAVADSQSVVLTIGELNGEVMETGIWIAKVNGWHVKARGVYPVKDSGNAILIPLLWSERAVEVLNYTSGQRPGAN